MSDVFSPEQVNEMFGAALDGGTEAMDKLAEATGLYIQDKLRENSFARKILTPQTVTASELTRNVNDEGLQYIDDIEPDSVAMAVNFRGEPNKTYIEGKRYAINISTISSERIQKSEQELRAYKMPLTKIIEQNTVKDIQETIDERFMLHAKAGIFLATVHRWNELLGRGEMQTSGFDNQTRNFGNEAQMYVYLYQQMKQYGATEATDTPAPPAGNVIDALNWNAGTVRTTNRPYFSNLILGSETSMTRNVVRDLAKCLASRALKLKTILLHESDFADLLAWSNTDAGFQISSEIAIGGYKYTTIAGVQYVTTVRDNPNIVAPGQIFGFPSSEFLGRFLVLENTKFFMKKEGRFITMEAWEDVGVGFGNIKGIACYLLSGASITLPARYLDPTGAVNTQAAAGAGNPGPINRSEFKILNVAPGTPAAATVFAPAAHLTGAFVIA